MERPAIVTAMLIGVAGCGVQGVVSSASPDDDSASAEVRSATQFGDPVPGLSADELARFNAGKEEFASVEGVEDGLGPVFNDSSCGNCHSGPALGGSSTRTVTRFGRITDGVFDPLANEGGSLIQSNGIGPAGDCNFVAETVPDDANVTAHRRTTPLFGLGLIDAVPDVELRGIETFEARAYPGQAGHPAVVPNIAAGQNTLGKFGWKGQNPTLHQFSGDAYVNEMGITNPEFPDENCPNGNCALIAECNPVTGLQDDGTDVARFTDFMSMLAPPPRGPTTAQTQRGQGYFSQVGCNHCHWGTLVTDGSSISALRYQVFHPYSDLLLHDMGPLGDGITQNNATGNLVRTAPLWGARAQPLHDGRAHTIDEAIRAHDGQGAAARDAYLALPAQAQSDLAAFVNSL